MARDLLLVVFFACLLQSFWGLPLPLKNGEVFSNQERKLFLITQLMMVRYQRLIFLAYGTLWMDPTVLEKAGLHFLLMWKNK